MLVEETGAKRGQLTCLRPHSWQMMKPGFEPTVWLGFFLLCLVFPLVLKMLLTSQYVFLSSVPFYHRFQQFYLNELNAEDMNIFQSEKEHQSENFSYFPMFVLKLNLTSQNSFFRHFFSFIPGLKRTMPPFYSY